ncbi:MAG: SH3 domain-containing protein [Asticcacaulis sp.]|nr:SH3 domain-containing protein [Asticcacaulis sp.]
MAASPGSAAPCFRPRKPCSARPDRSSRCGKVLTKKADIKAILKPRALASLDKCKKGWCRISAAGQTGWVPEQSLWGTQTAAVCKRPDPFAAR